MAKQRKARRPVRRDVAKLDMASMQLRQACGAYGAALLTAAPLRAEMAALAELYKAAVVYADTLREVKGEGG